MILSSVYRNLKEFVPQEGVVYKHKYEDILKDPEILAHAHAYLDQEGKNVYNHTNNLYLGAIRKHVLDDNFFIFYFVRSHTKPIPHKFAVQTSANPDYALQLYEQGKVTPFLEMRARGHLKSLDNESLALRCILKYPEDSTLFIAFRRSSAEGSMQAVMKIMEMDEIKHAFSDVLRENPKDGLWSVRNGIIVKRNIKSRHKSVECCGFYEGMNTGQHYRFIFPDDIMTEEMSQSEGMIQLGKEKFDNMGNMGFFGVEDEPSMVRVSGTPYAYDDVIMMIHEKVDKDGNKIYKTRKIREANDEDVPCFVTKSEHEAHKLSDCYRAQQQLDPSPEKIDSLNYDEIVQIDYEDIPSNLIQWIAVDPAGNVEDYDRGDKDNHAIVVLGAELERDINGMFNIYILDIIARTMTEAEAPHQIASMFQKHRAVQSVCIEQSYSGHLANLTKNLIKQRTGIELHEEDGSLIRLKAQTRGNKKNHINKVMYPLVRGHKLHMTSNVPQAYRQVLKREMDTFPTGKRDDILDATAYYPIILEKLHFDYRLRQSMSRKKKVSYLDEQRRKRRQSRLPYNEQYNYLTN
jgi:hypothetical protein